MNLKDFHEAQKNASTCKLLNGKPGTVNAIQLLREQQLKSHITKTPAMLVCVEGEVVYGDEHGEQKVVSQRGETMLPSLQW